MCRPRYASYTAASIAQPITDLAGIAPARVLVCGGGANNTDLMRRLAAAPARDASRDDRIAVGIAPDARGRCCLCLARPQPPERAGRQPAGGYRRTRSRASLGAAVPLAADHTLQ